MCFDKISARYLVNVPPHMSVADAVAEHRDRTGHGGMCMIVFAKVSRAKRRAAAQMCGELEPVAA